LQARADDLLGKLASGAPIYALIDGNHRFAALLRLAFDHAHPEFNMCDLINLVPHVANAPLALCRAVSALLNETHYMGRTASFVDSLYYMYETVQHLKNAGLKVTSVLRLTEELRGAGVHIIEKGSKEMDEHGSPMTGITAFHLRLYWEWIMMLDDEGMQRLVQLQNMDAPAIHAHLINRTTLHPLHPHGARVPNPLLSPAHSEPEMPDDKSTWTGEVGGWLPRLASNAFSPSKASKIFDKNTTTRHAIATIERGWMRWVLAGGKTLEQKVWATLSPSSYLDEESDSAAGEYCTALMAAEHQTNTDLLFINDLLAEAPALDAQATLAYAVMHFNAIHGARADLNRCIDKWHTAHPNAPASVSGLTISGMTSEKVFAQIVLKKLQRGEQLKVVRADYKALCSRLMPVLLRLTHEPDSERKSAEIEAGRGKETEFLTKWKLEGYLLAHTRMLLACARAHYNAHVPATPLFQVRTGQGFRERVRRRRRQLAPRRP